VLGKYLYVDSYDSGVLHRVDPASNTIVKSAKVAGGPCGVVAGAGSLWLEDYQQNAILRVNPTTTKLQKRIFVDKSRRTWRSASVPCGEPTRSRFRSLASTSRNKEFVNKIKINGSPTCIRMAAAFVWVGIQNSPFIIRINPKTNVATPLQIGNDSELCVDPHEDGIWVSDDASGTVTHLDPEGKKIATIRVGKAPSDGTRGPDGLEWIPNIGDGTITRIDPATDTVVDTIPLIGGPFVARSAFGSVWVGDFKGSQLWRLTP